ncbi:MAG: hypothetical protein PHG48_06940, partial [Eubacteriales bacterium]|nr:hypothetical protein [Eubacteriales bacterium]
MLSKARLMEYAKKSGIDVAAVAPASRFKVSPEILPPQFSPLTIFPDAKTVIICAREIPRGAFRGIEEGTLWQRSSRFIEPVYMYSFARCLEDEGCIAVPSTPLAKERWPEGVKFRSGKVEPNVYPDMDFAVVACGLGEIGYCGLVITPQFGV